MDSAPNYKGESRKACAHNNRQDSFWDSAPHELIARILSFLPCSNIYLAQGVCKKWRSIIWSPLFMLFCKEWSQPRRPWLLEYQQQMYNQAWAFDLDGWQWFHLNFCFLPENAIILASSGGLVCLGRSSKEGYQLYVCNPLTKKWRQLPLIPVPPGIVLLDVDHQANTYTIVALVFTGHARNSRPFGSVFVYNSKTEIWKEIIRVLQDLQHSYIGDACLCGTSLCFLTIFHEVEVFDIVEERWTTRNVRVPSMLDYTCSNLHIFKIAGKWGVLPTKGPNGKSILWLNVSARHWSAACSVNSIVCAARFSSLCSSAPSDDGFKVYTVGNEGHECYQGGRIVFLPKSPLTRQKMQGRNIVIGAMWYEPHLGAMV